MGLRSDILLKKQEILALYEQFRKWNQIEMSPLQHEQQRRAFFSLLEAIEPRLDSVIHEALVQLLVINEVYISMLKGELD